MILRSFVPFLLAVCAALLVSGPVWAGSPAVTEPGSPALVASYWSGFFDHWAGVFQKQNGIVLAALLVGAMCLFIITRGKWKK